MHFREIGLSIASGIISDGILKNCKIDESICTIKSIIPELLSAPIATNKPTRLGNIFTVISIPSFAPSKKVSNTLFFSIKPYTSIIKIEKGIATLET